MIDSSRRFMAASYRTRMWRVVIGVLLLIGSARPFAFNLIDVSSNSWPGFLLSTVATNIDSTAIELNKSIDHVIKGSRTSITPKDIEIQNWG